MLPICSFEELLLLLNRYDRIFRSQYLIYLLKAGIFVGLNPATYNMNDPYVLWVIQTGMSGNNLYSSWAYFFPSYHHWFHSNALAPIWSNSSA